MLVQRSDTAARPPEGSRDQTGRQLRAPHDSQELAGRVDQAQAKRISRLAIGATPPCEEAPPFTTAANADEGDDHRTPSRGLLVEQGEGGIGGGEDSRFDEEHGNDATVNRLARATDWVIPQLATAPDAAPQRDGFVLRERKAHGAHLFGLRLRSFVCSDTPVNGGRSASRWLRGVSTPDPQLGHGFRPLPQGGPGLLIPVNTRFRQGGMVVFGGLNPEG